MTIESYVSEWLLGLLKYIYEEYTESGHLVVKKRYYFCGFKYRETTDKRIEGVSDIFKRVWGSNNAG